MAYVDGRRAIVENHTRDKLKEYEATPSRLDYSKKTPAELARVFPRAQLVEAEIALRWNKVRVPLEVVTAIAAENPAWRYAERILLAMVGALSDKGSSLPLAQLDAFLTVFGNDFRAWYMLLTDGSDDATWFRAVTSRLVREVTTLPHDQPAWVLMAMLMTEEEDGPAVQEVYRRTEEQCLLD